MSLICSKHRLLILLSCAVILTACKSAPPEDDLPYQPQVSSSSASSKPSSVTAVSSSSKSSTASGSSATSSISSTSSATTDAGKAASGKPGKNAVATVANAPAVPAPIVIPPEAQAKFSKAMLQVYAGKIDEAAIQLEQVAAAYPTLSVPYINEGLMYLKAGQFEAAERSLKHAVERDANSAVANHYLGMAQRNLGKFKDAEASYLAALAADDNYAAAQLNLAILYDLYLQQPDKALPHYDRYLQLVPTPDTKVAGWIKEIRSRMGVGKKPAAPEAPPAAAATPAETGAKQ